MFHRNGSECFLVHLNYKRHVNKTNIMIHAEAEFHLEHRRPGSPSLVAEYHVKKRPVSVIRAS
jgi:hypothetical protein